MPIPKLINWKLYYCVRFILIIWSRMDVEESTFMIITLTQNFALVVRTDLVTKGNMILKVMGRCINLGAPEKQNQYSVCMCVYSPSICILSIYSLNIISLSLFLSKKHLDYYFMGKSSVTRFASDIPEVFWLCQALFLNLKERKTHQK